MADTRAAALAKVIRLALLAPVEEFTRSYAPGVDNPAAQYGGLESFHVGNIHEFCQKLLDTGYIQVDEAILQRNLR